MPPGFRLRIPDDLAELIRGLHPAIKAKIRAALDHLGRDPESGKPLRDELAGLRSLRVGRIRIIYRKGDSRTLEIVAIGPRSTIYQETYRRLMRGSRAEE